MQSDNRAPSNARDLHDYRLYALAYRVLDIIFEYATSDLTSNEPWIQDRRENEDVIPNPHYGQTADGLCLELYCGIPSMLVTPWGKWYFGGEGGGSWQETLPALLERLGATLIQRRRITHTGEFGPVYALHRVGDTPLPDPVLLPKERYLPPGKLNAAWAELTRKSKAVV